MPTVKIKDRKYVLTVSMPDMGHLDKTIELFEGLAPMAPDLSTCLQHLLKFKQSLSADRCLYRPVSVAAAAAVHDPPENAQETYEAVDDEEVDDDAGE